MKNVYAKTRLWLPVFVFVICASTFLYSGQSDHARAQPGMGGMGGMSGMGGMGGMSGMGDGNQSIETTEDLED